MKKNGPVTKEEVIEILETQLRRKDLKPNQAIALSRQLARLKGWVKRSGYGEVSVEKEPTEEMSVERLIQDIERKRREAARNGNEVNN